LTNRIGSIDSPPRIKAAAELPIRQRRELITNAAEHLHIAALLQLSLLTRELSLFDRSFLFLQFCHDTALSWILSGC